AVENDLDGDALADRRRVGTGHEQALPADGSWNLVKSARSIRWSLSRGTTPRCYLRIRTGTGWGGGASSSRTLSIRRSISSRTREPISVTSAVTGTLSLPGTIALPAVDGAA